MSTLRSELTLYHVLQRLLEQARDKQEPITSVDAFDSPDVKRFADTVNKVSDTLGHLWRRGYVDRFPAPKTVNSQAKFSYAWKQDKNKSKAPPARVQQDLVVPGPKEPARAEQAVLRAPARDERAGGVIYSDRPRIEISDDGKQVVIDLPALQILIRTRG